VDGERDERLVRLGVEGGRVTLIGGYRNPHAGLLRQANGEAADVTGGAAGDEVFVTTESDSAAVDGSLRSYAQEVEPLIIRAHPSMYGATIAPVTRIDAMPDRTIDFLHSGITIANRGITLRMVNAVAGHQDAANFIVRGVRFEGIVADDALWIEGRFDRPADLHWITRCTFTDVFDGCLDITGPPLDGRMQRGTIDWCEFGRNPGPANIAAEGGGPMPWDAMPNNDGRNGKGNLLGDGASNMDHYTAPAAALGITAPELAFRKRLTYHHNWHHGLLQRGPFLRAIRAHLYNNLTDNFGDPYSGGAPNGKGTQLNLYTDVRVENSIHWQYAVGEPHEVDGTLVTHPATDALYFDPAFIGQSYMRFARSGIVAKAGLVVRSNQGTVWEPDYDYTLDATVAGSDIADPVNAAFAARIRALAGAPR
jgi:pectate lyase